MCRRDNFPLGDPSVILQNQSDHPQRRAAQGEGILRPGGLFVNGEEADEGVELVGQGHGHRQGGGGHGVGGALGLVVVADGVGDGVSSPFPSRGEGPGLGVEAPGSRERIDFHRESCGVTGDTILHPIPTLPPRGEGLLSSTPRPSRPAVRGIPRPWPRRGRRSTGGPPFRPDRGRRRPGGRSRRRGRRCGRRARPGGRVWRGR